MIDFQSQPEGPLTTTTTSDRAAFVMSIDTEMAWGLNHKPAVDYRYDAEREHVQQLLALFDRHRTPATWATVGHLFLDRCEAVDGVKHPEIVRPDYDWFDGDWFDDDPCTSLDQDPTWYGSDVIDMIKDSTTDHEIASHGFSHIIAGDPGCSRETFDSEVQASRTAAAAIGIDLVSMVHPRNRIGHVDVLRDHGFSSYRGRRSVTPPAGVKERLIDLTRGSERTVVRPIAEDGIWNLPATIMFDIDARPRTWQLWIRQVERRLDQAVTQRSLFHLWFHPHNLRDHPEASFAALDRICRRAAAHRDAGRIDTVTMGGLAERLETERLASARPNESA